LSIVQTRKQERSGWTCQFFLICLSHDSLENHYRVNFMLMQHYKYSLTELETMIPWERQVYLGLLSEYIKEEREKEQSRRHQ